MIDGEQLFSGCGLGLRHCSEAHPCPIHEEFKKIREDITVLLENTYIGEFNQRLEENLLFLRRK